jgi:hypothetical protein
MTKDQMTHNQTLTALGSISARQLHRAVLATHGFTRSGNTRLDRLDANDVLTAFLRHLGYDAVADAFDGVHKWYA